MAKGSFCAGWGGGADLDRMFSALDFPLAWHSFEVLEIIRYGDKR